MISDKNIKIILQLLLFSTLGVYIILGELPQILLQNETNELKNIRLINLLKIASLIISVFTIFASFKWKFLLKIIFKENFVAGDYEGYAEKLNEKEDSIERHIEEFQVTQSLISTKISGKSKNEKGEFYAQWIGKLIEAENGHFKFFIDIETLTERSHGLMTLYFINGQVNGFGLLILSGMNHRWRFDAKKIE